MDPKKRHSTHTAPTRARKAHSAPQPRRKATDGAEDLYAILEELVKAVSLIKTAKRSLEHRDSNWDEIVTLEAAIKKLRQVDVALNHVADGGPSGITPEDATDDDEDDDEE